MAELTMELYSYVWPHLRPGRYRVDTAQTITGGGLGSGDVLPDQLQHLEVTAPRFAMPSRDVFGVFPPPNASGPFAGRLAQVVLRRRSLPWDRSASQAEPWLALVVLADGEANFIPDLPAPEAYTTGRAPTDIPADARCAALEVPQQVITAAFPARGETDLLAHVRKVDVKNTEYADEDGWVAVVISNRLPLPGKAYGAYLISLEGQLDVLPPPGAVENDVPLDWALSGIVAEVTELPRLSARGATVADTATGPTRAASVSTTLGAPTTPCASRRGRRRTSWATTSTSSPSASSPASTPRSS